jgi:hypothetical protein
VAHLHDDVLEAYRMETLAESEFAPVEGWLAHGEYRDRLQAMDEFVRAMVAAAVEIRKKEPGKRRSRIGTALFLWGIGNGRRASRQRRHSWHWSAVDFRPHRNSDTEGPGLRNPFCLGLIENDPDLCVWDSCTFWRNA